MAATVVEGTARKPVYVNADEPCPIAGTEVTAGKTANDSMKSANKARLVALPFGARIRVEVEKTP